MAIVFGGNTGCRQTTFFITFGTLLTTDGTTPMVFISSVSGYGVTSLIMNLALNEFVSFRQMADTKDGGEQKREKEWTGGTESFSLTENNYATTLTVDIDVPPGQEETFNVRYPKALERVKILAEKKE